jgi:hypothetical protein
MPSESAVLFNSRCTTGMQQLPVSGADSALAPRRSNVLWAICVVLLLIWALGLATSYTAGGVIHILLAIEAVVIVFRLL